MAKNKLKKYERVKHLSNVTFSQFGVSHRPDAYLWYDDRYTGMKKVLELGCGRGEHSLAFAGANPRRLYVGIDSKSHRICVGAEQAIALGLENVHFLRVRVERILEFFKTQSIHEIWLTFPDPHLKNRAVKNRLSGPLFLNAYSRLLVPGGIVHLKTDNDLLYTYTQKAVENWGGHIISATPNLHATRAHTPVAGDVVSSFERKARMKNLTIKYLTFRLD